MTDWYGQVITGLSRGYSIENVTRFNGTAHQNENIFTANLSMPYNGIVSFDILKVGLAADVSVDKNGTSAKLQSDIALVPNSHYIFDTYVKQSDDFNLQFNESTYAIVDIWMRRT